LAVDGQRGRITGENAHPWSGSLRQLRRPEDRGGEVYLDPDRPAIEASVSNADPIAMAHFRTPGPQQAAAVKKPSTPSASRDHRSVGYVFYNFLPTGVGPTCNAVWPRTLVTPSRHRRSTCRAPGNHAGGATGVRRSRRRIRPCRSARAPAAWAQFSIDSMEEKAPWWPIMNRRRPLLVSERLGNFIWGTGKQWYFANYFLRDA
jgi:hypothetical protein